MTFTELSQNLDKAIQNIQTKQKAADDANAAAAKANEELNQARTEASKLRDEFKSQMDAIFTNPGQSSRVR